ncbi:MAG: hypothetical protein GYB68_06465 [Chloroflexi bacterium]|nr:hypothetical protein [Chloroflexota bacterium]
MVNPPNRLRIKRSQAWILMLVWFFVVMLVGSLTFVFLLWVLSPPSGAPGNQPGIADVDTTPTPTLTPTPFVPPPPIEDPANGGSTPGASPSEFVPAAPPPPAWDRDRFAYGIELRLEFIPEQTLDMVDQIELSWVKQQIRWEFYERSEGQIEWDLLDAYFAALDGRNKYVLLSFNAAPDWAVAEPVDGAESPPEDAEDLARFIGAMLLRYPGQIHAVEVWNEPNLAREWTSPEGLSADDYVDLLATASETVRTIDPSIIVISAGLSPTGVDDGVRAIEDTRYLQDMIAAGALDHVDCVGVHHNGFNLPPDVAWDDDLTDDAAVFQGPFTDPHPSWSFESTISGANQIVQDAGSNTPLCVTEFGWATAEDMDGSPTDAYAFALDNTLDEQAEWIVEAFNSLRDRPYVQMAFLFNLDFSPKVGGDPQEDTALYSLLTPNGGPRPAFEALRDMPKFD